MREKISAKEVRGELVKEIEELSGQKVMACYQCGKCSSGCPIVGEMDLLPNQIIRNVQLGKTGDSLKSKTIWLCAACFTCGVRCPKGIDIAKLMEALRQLSLREHVDHFDLSELVEDEDFITLPQIALVSCFRKFTS